MIKTRTIIGLYISLLLLPLMLSALIFIERINFDYNLINDEIALTELREILLISYDQEIYSKQIKFIYKNDEFQLKEVNNKLLLQPGTQIFLNDIEDLYFTTKGNLIFVNYSRNKKDYEKIIGKKDGFYIDDFHDCASDCFLTSDSES